MEYPIQTPPQSYFIVLGFKISSIIPNVTLYGMTDGKTIVAGPNGPGQ